MTKSGGPGRGGEGGREAAEMKVSDKSGRLNVFVSFDEAVCFPLLFSPFHLSLDGNKLFSSFSKGEKTEWVMHFSLLFLKK